MKYLIHTWNFGSIRNTAACWERCLCVFVFRPVLGFLGWRREPESRWRWVWRAGWRWRRSRAGWRNPLEPPSDWIPSWPPWAQLCPLTRTERTNKNETSHICHVIREAFQLRSYFLIILHVLLFILLLPSLASLLTYSLHRSSLSSIITEIMNPPPPLLCPPQAFCECVCVCVGVCGNSASILVVN